MKKIHKISSLTVTIRSLITCAIRQILYISDITLDNGRWIGIFSQTIPDGCVHIIHQDGQLFIGQKKWFAIFLDLSNKNTILSVNFGQSKNKYNTFKKKSQ